MINGSINDVAKFYKLAIYLNTELQLRNSKRNFKWRAYYNIPLIKPPAYLFIQVRKDCIHTYLHRKKSKKNSTIENNVKQYNYDTV